MLQTQIEPHVEDLGFDAARLSRLPAFFDSYIKAGRLSGYGILVARHGRVAHLGFSGRSSFEGGFELASDSIFRIYSMTKPITSIALMMLYEAGLFQLHDPVTKFIPAFEGVRVFDSGSPREFTTREPERMITIHDLLTHQSGLTYDFLYNHTVDALYRHSKINGAHGEAYGLEEFAERVAKMPLVFSPGEHWNYSVSTDICGRLVEILSGKALDVFFKERIFAPLGMNDTSFTISEDKLARFTTNYMRAPRSGKITLADSPARTIYKEGRRFLSGGGGLLSTIIDYFKFCEMLRNGGRVGDTVFLSRKTLGMMVSNRLPNNETLVERATGSFSEVSYNGTGFGLGFGVVVDAAAAMSVSSAGLYSWGGAASTYFWIDPQEDLSVIFMTQMMPSGTYPVRPQLQQLVYAALVD